jgi:hypothetical protein
MSTNLTMRVMTITPQMALDWLNCSAEFKNRPSSEKSPAVRKIAADIKAGRFYLTGESIIVDDHGVVIDGKHRLLGVVVADLPIESVVVEGVSREAFRYIDQGKNRSVADVLGSLEIPNRNMAAAAARLVLSVERGVIGQFGSKVNAAISRDESINEASAPIYQQGAPYADALARARGVTASSTLAFYVLANQAGENQHQLIEFLDGVTTGADLRAGDPRLAFINTANKFGRERHLNVNQSWLALLIEAWCMFRDGRRLRGKAPEIRPWNGKTPFPAIKPTRPTLRTVESAA